MSSDDKEQQIVQRWEGVKLDAGTYLFPSHKHAQAAREELAEALPHKTVQMQDEVHIYRS